MKKLISAALLVAVAGGASAQVYVGGNFGTTHFSVDNSGTASSDDNDTGYKLYGGYAFNPNVAVELGYIDFGKAKATVMSPYYGQLDGQFKTTSVYLAAALRADLSRDFTGVVRLGLASANSKFEETQVATSITQSASGDKVQALLGLALEYSIAKNFKASVDADFSKSADINGESGGSVRMLSVGAQYSF